MATFGTPRSRVITSTGIFGKAFLTRMWQARENLQPVERRGFACFFYVTVCGHLEAVAAEVIKSRLKFVEHAVRWDALPPMRYTTSTGTEDVPIAPIVATVRTMVASVEAEVDTAPLNQLRRLYARVFPWSVSEILGPDLDADVQALGALRNLLAHGRDLTIEFEGAADAGFEGTLDGNALKGAAQRLQHAGVIPDFNITGLNHDEFFGRFFGDTALRHFHGVVREADSRLRVACDFVPERSCPHVQPLPPLD